jgi:hypothetical protein
MTTPRATEPLINRFRIGKNMGRGGVSGANSLSTIPAARSRRKRVRVLADTCDRVLKPSTAAVRPVCSAPRCAAESTPRASPLTTVMPRDARSSARRVAVSSATAEARANRLSPPTARPSFRGPAIPKRRRHVGERQRAEPETADRSTRRSECHGCGGVRTTRREAANERASSERWGSSACSRSVRPGGEDRQGGKRKRNRFVLRHGASSMRPRTRPRPQL